MNLWGVQFFLLMPDPPVLDRPEELPAAAKWYWEMGRFILLAAVTAWSVVGRFGGAGRRWDRYRLSAVTFALFLVLAPGFGVQYLVVIVPLLYAVNPKLATAYGLAAGAFLAGTYFLFWDGAFPISSLFDRLLPTPLAAVGLLAWGTLIYFLAWAILRPSNADATARASAV